MRPKFIFISGGVISGIGKGLATAAISLLLKSRGFMVSPIKCDPYINVDAGTMNPVVHGEIFVLDDGSETDQDLGHYERFLGENLSALNYMTTGQVYQTVIARERNLEYGGKCVEVVPHIPEEIIRRIEKGGEERKANIVLVEIGGTVGEYQNALFLEANRMLKLARPEDVLHIHLGYLPIPLSIGEMKSKPVQMSVRALNSVGLQPDFILGRSEKPLDEIRKEKLALFCNVDKDDVISAPDVTNIYEIPLNFEKQNLTEKILKKFGLKSRKRDLLDWEKMVQKSNQLKKEVKIGIVAKYYTSGDFSLGDSYISVLEAIKHAAWFNNVKPEIVWIDSEKLETLNTQKLTEALKGVDGVVVPQGWGSRGVEGKIKAVQYARENKIPYLGLCFGMQMAVIEFGRNVLGLTGANSTEVNPKTKHPVIHIMPDQKEYLEKHQYGGTIRLGAWPCKLIRGTKTANCYEKYNKTTNSQLLITNYLISERHRHRYEFNNKYQELFEKAGMKISGVSPDGKLIEAVEIPDHPFFVGIQFHPEYKSRFLSPHPLFLEFIKAAMLQ
ncbi:MAG: CTP synthase [Patescibacteria group bacterium]